MERRGLNGDYLDERRCWRIGNGWRMERKYKSSEKTRWIGNGAKEKKKKCKPLVEDV